MGTRFLSLTAFSISDGTSDCKTSPLISSAKRRRISVAGALPGRNPGTRATRANSRATFSTAFWTVSAGTSRSSSRRQLASVMVLVVEPARKHAESVRPFALMRLRKEDREERARRGKMEYRIRCGRRQRDDCGTLMQAQAVGAEERI